MAFNFGSTTTKPTLSLFGNANTNNNANNTTSLFGSSATANAPTAQPSTNLFGASTMAPANNNTTNNMGSSTTLNNTTSSTFNNNASTAATSGLFSNAANSTPQIDITHLRNTTKFDHLTPDLQNAISSLDTAILNQMQQCTEVADLLPAVVAAGSQTSPAIEFVSSKLEELEVGLENDAEGIVNVRGSGAGGVRRDEGEAKCVFRAVDRLRVPRQYQVGGAGHQGSNSVDGGSGVSGGGVNGNAAGAGSFGGMGNGLSGWWNHPSTVRGNSVRAGGVGQSVQFVDDSEDGDGSSDGVFRGPQSLVELFNERVGEMGDVSKRHMELLGEIEMFVEGLEGKVAVKERDVQSRLELGRSDGGVREEREHQMQLLRYVFGEVQRGLYEVAEKIGSTRDQVVELGIRR